MPCPAISSKAWSGSPPVKPAAASAPSSWAATTPASYAPPSKGNHAPGLIPEAGPVRAVAVLAEVLRRAVDQFRPGLDAGHRSCPGRERRERPAAVVAGEVEDRRAGEDVPVLADYRLVAQVRPRGGQTGAAGHVEPWELFEEPRRRAAPRCRIADERAGALGRAGCRRGFRACGRCATPRSGSR